MISKREKDHFIWQFLRLNDRYISDFNFYKNRHSRLSEEGNFQKLSMNALIFGNKWRISEGVDPTEENLPKGVNFVDPIVFADFVDVDDLAPHPNPISPLQLALFSNAGDIVRNQKKGKVKYNRSIYVLAIDFEQFYPDENSLNEISNKLRIEYKNRKHKKKPLHKAYKFDKSRLLRTLRAYRLHCLGKTNGEILKELAECYKELSKRRIGELHSLVTEDIKRAKKLIELAPHIRFS